MFSWKKVTSNSTASNGSVSLVPRPLPDFISQPWCFFTAASWEWPGNEAIGPSAFTCRKLNRRLHAVSIEIKWKYVGSVKVAVKFCTST